MGLKHYYDGEDPKVGDVVKCIDPICDRTRPDPSTEFTVYKVELPFVTISGEYAGGWYANRFKLVSRRTNQGAAMHITAAKFWMVLGNGTPAYRHETKKAAATEAERLARLNPNVEFVVLEAVGAVCKTDVTWRPLGDSSAMPGCDVPF